jgi:hypothetical protein
MLTHNLTKAHRHRLAAVGARTDPTAATPPLTIGKPVTTPPAPEPTHRAFERQPPSAATVVSS